MSAGGSSRARRERALLAGALLAVAALFFVSFLIGRYPVPPDRVIRIFAAQLFPIERDWPEILEVVLLQVRLPRIAAAMAVGGALAVAGACYQTVFRNPLVSPFILGVSSGAGFGAALAILLFGGRLAIQLSAFAFGVAAVALCYGMSRVYRAAPTLVLVLSGIIVGALFMALLSLIKYTADPENKLPVIEFWLMGSLASAGPADAITLVAVAAPCIGALLALRWKLNVLAMGEEEARTLGIDVTRLRAVAILLATVVAASAVAVCGIIGWVGLVVPHLARMLTGPDLRRLMPMALTLGAGYLLFIDNLARTLIAAEIPLGILTALVGAPVFAALLRRSALGWA